MKELLGPIERWQRAGQAVAIARVVGIEGSGPREPGAAMAVNENGEVAGSVSGGCVEGAVVEVALELLANHGGPRLCTFGYSDDEAFAVGLTCGGTVHLLVERLDEESLYEPLRTALREERPVALATVTATTVEPIPILGGKLVVADSSPTLGSLGSPELDRVVERDARAALELARTTSRQYGPRGEARGEEITVFIESFARRPRLIIFGAVDFTGALSRVGKVLGYRVTVCDARPTFATRARFPVADEVIVDWPDRYLEQVGDELGPRDAVCVLTHDHKFDVPAIQGALATAVGYIGAMGSRRTHAGRTERLIEAGVDPEDLRRVMGPIGLDIGARTPEETAISICAEIIAQRSARLAGVNEDAAVPARSLRDADGPIHWKTA